MKKQYTAPSVQIIKVEGGNTLMSESIQLNGHIDPESGQNDIIDIPWGGSSRNDDADRDNQGRLWGD